MESSTPILRTENLTKRYGTHVALDSLNIAVHRGEVFGYIGPNGAGKTTTFRILCGLLDPTEGKAFVADKDVTGNKDLIKQLVGYLPDNFGVYPALKVWEYLAFFAQAYKVPAKLQEARITECLRIADSEQFRDKLMGALSRGMKQRVGIAKTLLHDPQVLILDEPAATIDPRARIQMRRLLRDLAGLGKAVLVSSHILPELADVCDTVGILSRGKMIAKGPVNEILRQVRPRRLIEIHVLKYMQEAQRLMTEVPGDWTALPVEMAATAEVGGVLRYEAKADDEQLAASMAHLVKNNVPVAIFREVHADLEDAFMTLTS